MYRSLKTFDGREMGEVESSITVDRPLAELKDFLLSVDHANDIIGHDFELEAEGRGSFSWTFDGPLMLDFQGRGTVGTATPTTVVWRAHDNDSRGLELKLDLRRAGNGTKVSLSCLFDHPGKLVGDILMKYMGAGPDTLARSLLAKLKLLAETSGHGRELSMP